ncbi:MAG TPA: hypothetical protein VD846_05050 [Allosphingosinicella sp.]|nr:hypothetical protein [Allosphingosinicella sp.]
MKNQPAPLARAAALLLAAAALPIAPLLAQETAPPANEPAAEAAEPPAAETSIPAQPEQITPDPSEASPDPVTEAEATEPAAPARTTTTRRTTTRTTTRAPAVVTAPAPVAVVPVPVATVPTVSTAPLPPPVAQTPPLEVLPETPPAPVATTVETEDPRDSFLPWLLAGLVLLGALAFFALRGRRRTAVHDRVRDEMFEPAPVAAAPVAAAPIVAPVDTRPAGRPELDLAMRPVRAGVSGEDARVEFELTVGNSGPVAAEDVRISTWMLAAGSSEAESALIVPRDHADTPPVTIPAGEARTMEASVALPTSRVDGDSVLPVVVADARYRLPDGSEGRTSASFAVGVPDGEELAHFGIDNPSGLHEGVVARPLGEPERA